MDTKVYFVIFLIAALALSQTVAKPLQRELPESSTDIELAPKSELEADFMAVANDILLRRKRKIINVDENEDPKLKEKRRRYQEYKRRQKSRQDEVERQGVKRPHHQHKPRMCT